MGTRTLFVVQDSENQLLATLFANCSHPLQDAEAMFSACAETPLGPTGLLQMLLSCRYGSDSGPHKKGDRVFWLVAPAEREEGDFEAIMTARYAFEFGTEHNVLARIGPHKSWQVSRTERAAA